MERPRRDGDGVTRAADPGLPSGAPDTRAVIPDAPDAEFALAFEDAFQRVYSQFHRRDGKRSGISSASRAVLTHLAHAGPLTVGEMSGHLDRAQSVVSDIVSGLEAKDLLAREPDPADRRRTLVWLTPAGLAALDADRRVLSVDLLGAAAEGLPAQSRAALLDGMRALLDAPIHPVGAHAGPATDPEVARPDDAHPDDTHPDVPHPLSDGGHR
jgi:DNA-binding MarR family transcriptional regulator